VRNGAWQTQMAHTRWSIPGGLWTLLKLARIDLF